MQEPEKTHFKEHQVKDEVRSGANPMESMGCGVGIVRIATAILRNSLFGI